MFFCIKITQLIIIMMNKENEFELMFGFENVFLIWCLLLLKMCGTNENYCTYYELDTK